MVEELNKCGRMVFYVTNRKDVMVGWLGFMVYQPL